MGIAYSGSEIVHATFAAGSRAEAITGLHAALVQAGWEWVSLADGYKYTITSPQDLKAKMTLRDTDKYLGPGVSKDNPAFDIQFMSFDETRQGPVHWLRVASGRTLQVVANICQMFVSRPGVTADLAHVACGGVPWVPVPLPGSECTIERGNDIETTEAWWSNGDVHTMAGFWTVRCFRQSFMLGYPATYAACRNGDLLTSPGDATGLLRLIPYAQQQSWPFYMNPSPITRLFNDAPLRVEPLLAWGASGKQGPDGKSFARIKGQVWDAFWLTEQRTVEDIETMDGSEWINYTYENDVRGSRLGCLYLLRETAGGGPSGGLGNYAY
ncbi:MAG: hypothetical protein FJW34_11985 [Acidobacteria bacterium]|nr:hypothetical protein [Acidobacteriota bacterium]